MQHSRLAETPIAIVGLAGLFPKSRDLREFWHNIVDAEDCIEDVPESHWNTEDYYDPDPAAEDKTYVRRGGFLPEIPFNPMEFGLPPNTLEVTDILQLLSLTVARDVLRDSGADQSNWYDASRTGVILGITGANSLTQPLSARLQTPVLKEVVRSVGLSEADAEEIAQRFKKAYIPWEENSFPGMLGNVVAGRIANRFDLGGTNCTVDAACASSLAAVKLAVSELIEGRADMMITGGCDAENTILMYMCFSKTPAFSRTQQIRPFDESADGTLIGEGIGMLALKRLADAERDGDRIYSVLRGIGTSSDGRFKSIYAPRAEGQQLALRRAYADADVPVSAIELFEAHGTGTAVGDHTELAALSSVVSAGNDDHGYAAIGSVKSQIGHTKAAAGAASLIKLSLALHQKVLPPTINVETPSDALDPASTPFYVNTEARPWVLDPERDKRRAAVSSFGFGGTNFHMVLEEHDGTDAKTLGPVVRWGLWHAAGPEALALRIENGAATDETGAIPASDARIGIVARSDVEFAELRDTAVELLRARPDAPSWQHPKGITYRRAALPTSVKTAAVFAGQGSQYVGMGRRAAIALPPLRAAFDRANRLTEGPDTLARTVFPPPAFTDTVRREQETALRRTDFAQPAIGALSAGQYTWLRELGFRADGVIGHSFGELTALWAAGALDDEQFARLARARGTSMAPPEHAPADFDPGAMAAIRASLSDVQALVATYRNVAICNINAPGQIVVGGPTDEIDRLVADVSGRRIPAKRLPVSAAFHTGFVAHAADAFRQAVESTGLETPAIPVYANTPGSAYGTDTAANRRTLVDQLLQPVDFVSGIEKMYADGFRVFVEFGPKRVLTDLVDRILEGRTDVVTLAVDGGPSKDSEVSLKRAAIELAVLGLPLVGFDDRVEPRREQAARKGMTIPLRGINYVTEERRSAYRDALSEPLALTAAAPAPVNGSGSGSADDGIESVVREGLGLQAEILTAHVDTVHASVRSLEQSVRAGGHPDTEAALRLIREQGATIGAAHERSTRLLLEALRGAAVEKETVAEEVVEAEVVEAEIVETEVVDDRVVDDRVVEPEPVYLPEPEPAPIPEPEPAPVAGSAIPAGVMDALLGAVAEKTGYPVEMLEPGMDVEADLGIDSIKRVQILGALQESYPVSEDVDPEVLAELRTLDDIAGFLASTLPAEAAPEPTPVTEPEPQPAPVSVADAAVAAGVMDALLGAVAEKTGYPVEMLEPGMDVEADLGIDSIKRVQILGALQESYPVSEDVDPEVLAELRTLDDIAGFLASTVSTEATPAPAPVSAPAPASTPEPEPAPASVSNSAVAAGVMDALLGAVAEKTGYPVEMLEPGMDVEADLGIDSIKRVQILGALQESYPVSEDVDPEVLAELRTLDDIAGFLASTVSTDSTPTPTSSPAPASAPTTPLTITYPPTPGIGRTYADVTEIASPHTLVGAYAESRTAVVVDDGSLLTRPLAGALRGDGWRVEVVSLPGVDSVVPEADAVRRLVSWDEGELAANLASGRVDLVVQMAAAAGPEWAEGTRRLEHCLLVAKNSLAALKAVAAQGTRAGFVAVTRLDGASGYRGAGDASPLLGGVAGLVKTLAIEVPELFVRTVDFAPELALTTVGARFLAEIDDLSRAYADVAHDPAGRRTVALAAEPHQARAAAVPEVSSADLFVVTGGARGITADCLHALVSARPAGLLLLGRSRPAPEPDWAVGTEGPALRGLIARRAAQGGQKPNPRAVEAEFREITASREIAANLARLTATGARVEYLTVDITDAAETRRVLTPYAGRVTGVVHGAGVLADRLVAQKSAEEIRRVLATKLLGLGNVLDVLRGIAELRHLVLFSSVAGFFGNRGQSDYAMANEALNRIAVRLKRELPNARVTAMNWGAWDGGMVSDDLRAMFAQRGIALVPLTTGAGMFAEQFTADHAHDTVIVTGPLTPLSAPPEAQGAGLAPLVVDRTLADLAGEPLLTDHTIGDRRVLPATAALGLLANAIETATGEAVTGASGFKVFKGVSWDEPDGQQPQRLRLAVEPAAGGVGVDVLASSVDSGGRSRPAYSVRLSTGAAGPRPADRTDLAALAGSSAGRDAAPLYRDGTLFHGPSLRGLRSVLAVDEQRLLVRARLADSRPAHGGYHGRLHSPVLADLLLQSVLVWVRERRGRACLPMEIGRLSLFEPLPSDGDFLIAVEDIRPGRTGVTCTVTAFDPRGRVLAVLRDVVAVEDAELESRFRQPGRAAVSV
ncbi:type I polyketide synthase [Streptomyces pseudovenezuelae]|uniref:Acyl transferase domain-containing protein/acyl carrier protein n=1 Tax=Streptomyces pseudovenezuelae TaxID=67350 RepID=A0ABT6LKN1_9ACTN|nr:type I polyketide synthase [Streptomyces pseudovenezuelae]MDH6216862.1 acyl transferase domain-containing protein/acyl carrier protein [Streptomyces pseudovenezuelae]